MDSNTITVRMQYLLDKEDFFAETISKYWYDWTMGYEFSESRSQNREIADMVFSTDAAYTGASAHSHKTAIPKLCQISDSLKAQYIEAILPHDDVVEFQADEDTDPETKYDIESYIRSRHKMYGHKAVVQSLIDDYVDEGNAYVKTVYEKRVASVVGAEKIRGYIGPRMIRIAPSSIAYDPRSTSFDAANKIVQEVRTLGDIAQEIANEQLPEVYRDVLKEAMEFRTGVRSHAEILGDEWMNIPMSGWGNQISYYSGNQVELLTFYGTIYDADSGTLLSNREIVVVDRKWILSDKPIETLDGNPPIRHAAWRKNKNSLVGMSPLANLVGMQYMINHWENAQADALDAMISPDRVLSGVQDIVDKQDGSKEYHIYEKGSVGNLAPDTTILSATGRIQALEHQMEQFAGVPPEAFGFKTPGEQTKFEVSERMSRGALLFRQKTEQFEEILLLPAINDELEAAAKNVDTAQVIEVSEPEGDVFRAVNVETLKRKGSLIPTGASNTKLKAQYAQELQAFQNTLLADPSVAVHFPAKKLANAWNNILTGGRRRGLFEEFGRVTEEVEMQQMQQAANEVMAENESVSTLTDDGLAPQLPSDPSAPQ